MADADFVLPAAGEFLGELLDLAEPPAMPDGSRGTRLESLAVDMPVEIALETSGNGVALCMAPPTQTTLTSVFPVLHRLGLRVTVNVHG